MLVCCVDAAKGPLRPMTSGLSGLLAGDEAWPAVLLGWQRADPFSFGSHYHHVLSAIANDLAWLSLSLSPSLKQIQ